MWVWVVLVLLPACDCAPARSKPWRHAPDPQPEPSQLTGLSETVADEAARLEARQRRGDTLRIHMRSRPKHLNPMIAPSVWTLRVAADTIFETLVRYEPPEPAGAGPGRYRPGLARSWRVAPGGREIRIDLQPDVRFHDGRRMTSVDVQFSLDAVRDPRVDAGHLRQHFDGVTSVELISPTALRVRLARPNAYVLRALAEIPILPAHVYEKKLRDPPDEVIGTGPYRLASRAGRIISLERNPDYWGAAPAIGTIEFEYVPDAAEALLAAKRGDFDVVPVLIEEHYPEQASVPGIVASFAPLRLQPATMRFLAVDTTTPPFDDARVRRALGLLVDRGVIAKQAHGGLARPIAGPIWPGGPGDGPGATPPKFDPDGAGRLLDQSGWRDADGDGVRDRDGRRLRPAILALEGVDVERQLIVERLRKLGISVYPRVGPRAVLQNRLRAGDFDLALVEWRGGVDRDLSPLYGTGGSLNYGRFSDPRVDQLLASLRSAWEPEARAPLMAELSDLLSQLWPVVPIVAPHPYGLVHRRVRGVKVWDGWISLRALSLDPAATDDD